MKRLRMVMALLLLSGFYCRSAQAFCGFYVASGDAKLFNHASQVVLVRDRDRTVITMASDYRGEPKDFAVVVPVPTVIEKEQVHVGDKAIVDHLDAYSAPRLVEYWDPDPCAVADMHFKGGRPSMSVNSVSEVVVSAGKRIESVTIERQFSVDEYDILVLSATESGALEQWLRENHYRIPDGAGPVLGSYLKQGMKFFVAKVNLKEKAKLGFTVLRPIQVAYESPKFMLPIRLGMVNADGPQELFVYALTRSGRVEATNYRTLKLPTDMDVPEYVKPRWADFYRALFSRQAGKESAVLFTEYAWDMGSCDPCASPPLSADELRQLGVFWSDDRGRAALRGQPTPTFVTRLHVRYDAEHFPEDLTLQETADRTNWQARYIMHHPWRGQSDCSEADAYRAQLRERRVREADNLASLTGWTIDDIRRDMNVAADWSAPEENLKWYQRLWKK